MSVIRYERHDGVALIELNRPERRNALDDALTMALGEALRRARDDDDVRAVVLAGAGKGFCAGADLSVFEEEPSGEFVQNYIVQTYGPLMGLMTQMQKPIVGAINGAAAGAGAALALACDLRVMASDAYLIFAFIHIGLVPDAGASWLLARQVGYSRAFEIAVEGEKVHAERCRELGLANRVVEPEALRDEALGWAQKLSYKPTVAVGLTKRVVQHALVSDLQDTLATEAAFQRQTVGTKDHREGVAAFMERRAPKFTGE